MKAQGFSVSFVTHKIKYQQLKKKSPLQEGQLKLKNIEFKTTQNIADQQI